MLLHSTGLECRYKVSLSAFKPQHEIIFQFFFQNFLKFKLNTGRAQIVDSEYYINKGLVIYNTQLVF